MEHFAGRVAVITGAGSGFGREFAREAVSIGMRVALADIREADLQVTADELRGRGASVMTSRVDVSDPDQVQAFADGVFEQWGAVNLLFNNAGVATGGLIWEHSHRDWQWLVGVNVMGVANGIRSFVPRMIAQQDDSHVVNTASVAGLISPQLMGIYNVSKHAVVAMSESLYHDLSTVHASLGVTVLCPAYVNTGINRSERSRPAGNGADAPPTQSMKAAQQAMDKAVSAGRISARDIAVVAFDAVRGRQFYCLPHPGILPSVELRMTDVLERRNPSDPFAYKPALAPGR